MHYILMALAFIFSFLSTNQVCGQDSTKQTKKERSGLLILPAVIYSPETSLGFGGAGIQYFRNSEDTISNPSNIQGLLLYTLENQVLITFPYNLYFENEKYWLRGEWAYYIYPYEYYGVGTDVNIGDDGFETYTANFLRLETNVLVKSRRNFHIGGTLAYDNYFQIKTDKDGTLESENIKGVAGGEVLGLGATMIIDRRNNVFAPTGGYYLECRALQYQDVVIGDYPFTDMYVDARKYYEPTSRWEAAFQFYHQSVLGDPPFYNYALLGGSKIMRGYYKGAYRDHHLTVLQTEWRRYLTKRIVASAFGGLGSVAGSFGSYDKLLGSYGIGVRYEINTAEKLRIRVDYARGANTSGFYFNISEAF